MMAAWIACVVASILIGGTDGQRGIPGVPGPQGQKGERGYDGLPGLTGIKGQKGEPLLDCPRYIIGTPGMRGFAGHPGIPGKQGEKGLTGTVGSKGQKGKRGTLCLSRAQDPADVGKLLRRLCHDNTGKAVEQFKKLQKNVTDFRTSMDVAVSRLNQLSLLLTRLENHGKKTQTGLPGLPGKKGEAGESGADGLPGEKGIKGEKGESNLGDDCHYNVLLGPPGPNGYDGIPGVPGPDGLDGSPGLKGDPGQKGHRGSFCSPGSEDLAHSTDLRGWICLNNTAQVSCQVKELLKNFRGMRAFMDKFEQEINQMTQLMSRLENDTNKPTPPESP